MTVSEIILIAAICTIISSLMTFFITAYKFKQKVFEEVIKDVKGKFGGLFMSKEDYLEDKKETRECLDAISTELKKGAQEFLILRLILMEAELVSREKIEEIRDTVMNGGL